MDTDVSIIGSNVLIVDDIPVNIHLLGHILESEGCVVYAVTDSLQAIEHAIKHTPDVILMDIRMPVMDGFSVCIALQQNEHTRAIPVIFITALSSIDNIIKGFECGAVDYLVKPLKQQEVLIRVKTHLKNKKLLEEVKRQKANAIAANQLKDKFVSLVAHDLRAPLVSQISCLSTMLHDPHTHFPPQYTAHMQLLIQNAQTQLHLIDNILNMNRLQSGSMKLQKMQLDLHMVVNSALQELALTAAAKQIELHNQVPINTVALVDGMLFKEVCKNLVSNAIKFSHLTSPVTLQATVNTDAIIIVVKDQGVGMDAKTQAALFSLGNISLPGTLGERGTGLGLSYCQDIMHAHGGHIAVESSPNRGSAFYLHLPVIELTH